ncbi:hypothetical protein [Bosea sp. Root381]|uniref:hypothetical protein n=1 Tax=Bosea sp. Root381 TaxID=1736524 RepID=UPI00138F72AC|nr:hypothetical protein [Bosea sp. Root381]
MDDTTERLDRLQMEVSQLREMVIIQTVILQALALKAGIAPQTMMAMSPVPIPEPSDLMAMLKPKG